MTAAKLDPALFRKLADIVGLDGIFSLITPKGRQDIFAQLSAAADLAERPTLTEERVREVVETAFAKVSSLSGEGFAQRIVEDIATRAAKELAGAVVDGNVVRGCAVHDGAVHGGEAEELRAGIEALIADPPGGGIESNREWKVPLQALLDRVNARDSLAHLERVDAQREADLREAWHAGAEWMAKVIEPRNAAGKLTSNEAGLYLSLPAEARVEREAAAYARSKEADRG